MESELKQNLNKLINDALTGQLLTYIRIDDDMDDDYN